MSRNQQHRILLDIAGDFLGADFSTKTAELTHINRFALNERVLHGVKKGFEYGPADGGIKLSPATNPVYYILLCHFYVTDFEGNRFTFGLILAVNPIKPTSVSSRVRIRYPSGG